MLYCEMIDHSVLVLQCTAQRAANIATAVADCDCTLQRDDMLTTVNLQRVKMIDAEKS